MGLTAGLWVRAQHRVSRERGFHAEAQQGRERPLLSRCSLCVCRKPATCCLVNSVQGSRRFALKTTPYRRGRAQPSLAEWVSVGLAPACSSLRTPESVRWDERA